MTTTGRVTLLAGGGTIYVYPDATGDPALRNRIAVQRMLLDVAYPGDDVDVFVITEAKWDSPQMAAIREEADVVDTREEAP